MFDIVHRPAIRQPFPTNRSTGTSQKHVRGGQRARLPQKTMRDRSTLSQKQFERRFLFGSCTPYLVPFASNSSKMCSSCTMTDSQFSSQILHSSIAGYANTLASPRLSSSTFLHMARGSLLPFSVYLPP